MVIFGEAVVVFGGEDGFGTRLGVADVESIVLCYNMSTCIIVYRKDFAIATFAGNNVTWRTDV